MNKFALIAKAAEESLYLLPIKHRASMRKLIKTQATDEDVERSVEEFKKLLDDWFSSRGMQYDPKSILFTDTILKHLKPYLKTHMVSEEERLYKQFPQDPSFRVLAPEEASTKTPREKARLREESERYPELQDPVQASQRRDAVPTTKRPLDDELRKMASDLASLADAMDDAGMYDDADRIAFVLPRLGILKQAQYEGVQHYWLMNGRAFEKAWREKRKKKPTDDSEHHTGNEPDHYRSANDCWWEVLEEYQESLYGDHATFLGKYAKKKDDDKEVEQGTTVNPSQTMSKEMTDFHKRIKEKGLTEGQGWVEWLASQNKKQAADQILFQKIAENLEAGSSPGVAFYEALDFCLNDGYVSEITGEIRDIVADASSSDAEKVRRLAQDLSRPFLVKSAAGFGDTPVWDVLKAPFEAPAEIGEVGLGNWWDRLKGMFSGQGGGFFSLISKIQGEMDRLEAWQEQSQDVDGDGVSDVPAAVWKAQLNPVMTYMEQFFSQLPDSGVSFDREKVEKFLVDDEEGTVPPDNLSSSLPYINSMADLVTEDFVKQVYKNRSLKQKAPQKRAPKQQAPNPANAPQGTPQPTPGPANAPQKGLSPGT